MSSTGLRFKKYLEYKGVKRADFSETTEIPYNSLSSILNGNRNVSSDILEKMFTYFPDLNARWLVTGKGPMEYTAASYHLDPVLEQQENYKQESEDFVKNLTEQDLDKLLDEMIEKENVRKKFKEIIKENLGMNEKENSKK